MSEWLGFTRQKVREESMVQFEDHPLFEAEIYALEHFHQLFTVDKFDGWCSIAISFAASVCRECTGCHNDALVSTAKHCVPEIADLSSRY